MFKTIRNKQMSIIEPKPNGIWVCY